MESKKIWLTHNFDVLEDTKIEFEGQKVFLDTSGKGNLVLNPSILYMLKDRFQIMNAFKINTEVLKGE